MWSFGNLARSHNHPHHHPMGMHHGYGRANYAEGMSTEKKNAMMDAGIYKGTAVVTAGLVGGISAYKGLPEIKNFAGFDILTGVLLSGVEFYMLWKGGMSGRAVAAVGGVSTGLLCHWAAVQGTIRGVQKARTDGGTPAPTFNEAGVRTNGAWDDRHYDAHDQSTSVQGLPDPGRNIPQAPAPQAQTQQRATQSFDYGMI